MDKLYKVYIKGRTAIEVRAAHVSDRTDSIRFLDSDRNTIAQFEKESLEGYLAVNTG